MQRGLLLCVVLAVFAAAPIRAQDYCGKVTDGLLADIDELPVGSALGAHWMQFAPEDSSSSLNENSIVKYEWAVVTEASLHDSSLHCSSKPMFSGFPDTAPWENVGRRNFGSRMLEAEVGQKYHVVVRAVTGTGNVVYGLSDGFEVVDAKENIHIRRDVDEESSHSIGKRAVPGVAPNSNAGTACPIDEENRCRQSKIRIGDVLTEIYGPPEWATALNPVRETYIFTHFDDDDNLEQSSSSGAGIPVGAILGIAFGVAGLVLLAMLLVALLSSFERKSDKFKTNVHRHDNYEEF